MNASIEAVAGGGGGELAAYPGFFCFCFIFKGLGIGMKKSQKSSCYTGFKTK